MANPIPEQSPNTVEPSTVRFALTFSSAGSQHAAVGRDQRQIDAERPVQSRTELLHDDLHQLHQRGNHHDEQQDSCETDVHIPESQRGYAVLDRNQAVVQHRRANEASVMTKINAPDIPSAVDSLWKRPETDRFQGSSPVPCCSQGWRRW